MNSRVEILLVEDDLCLARSVVRQLKVRGIGVRHCASVKEAELSSGPFRVGVFDIDLPDGDGVSLAGRMLRRGQVIRAVFNTGCSDGERLSAARKLGMVFEKSETLPLVSNLLTPSIASCAGRHRISRATSL